jgi:hypothetical protein
VKPFCRKIRPLEQAELPFSEKGEVRAQTAKAAKRDFTPLPFLRASREMVAASP